MDYSIAFYGGSFDPFTEGHRVCLCHAITLYNRVIIGVGVNHGKKSLLSPEQRVLLIKDSLSDFVSMYVQRVSFSYPHSATDFFGDNNTT